jgi:hypothetical protein
LDGFCKAETETGYSEYFRYTCLGKEWIMQWLQIVGKVLAALDPETKARISAGRDENGSAHRRYRAGVVPHGDGIVTNVTTDWNNGNKTKQTTKRMDFMSTEPFEGTTGNPPEQKKMKGVQIMLMFVAETDEQALAVKQAVGDAIADIPGMQFNFTIQERGPRW